jgi:hypothetical protein
MKKLDPVYFENQKQCASALGLDEHELKGWKAQNCPAFRYGRIYHAELLEWLKNHKPHARRNPPGARIDPLEPAETGDARTDRMLDVCKTIIALTNCANRGLMADERYLEIGTEIFRSITDEIKEWPEAKPIIVDWSTKLMEYLCSNFKDLEASHKAHPKLVGWLCRVGGLQGVAYGGKQHLAD